MSESRSSWGIWGLGAVLLGAVAALFGLRQSDKGNALSNQTRAGAKSEESGPGVEYGNYDDPARRALLKLLDNDLPDAPPPPQLAFSLLPAPKFSMRELDCRDQRRVKVLIVTVPDPIDTPFGYWFDEYVDCLTRAASEFGYVPARHYFPWEQYRRDKQRAEADKLPLKRPAFLDHPGILLFRESRSGNPNFNILAMLLVSEMPASVRAEPLREAVKLVSELQARGQPIRVIGPSFTGALPSLKVTLQPYGNWLGILSQDFKVISPSANGLDIPSIHPEVALVLLTFAIHPVEALAPLLAVSLGCVPDVHTLMPPNEFLQNAAIQFLKWSTPGRSVAREQELSKRNHKFFGDVAILTESNTAFGVFVQDVPKLDSTNRTTKPRKQLKEQVPPPFKPLVLKYPMYLSRLSAKYTQDRQEREKQLGYLSDANKTNPTHREPRPNHDIILGLDSDTIPPINDRTVDDIIEELLRERIRYVGISSTDPQDKVFLVERIKQACPNVTIFVSGTEMYYALPENRHIMRGVIFVSPYPMYPANDEWTSFGDRRRQFFISHTGQGCYNAAVFHLGGIFERPDDVPLMLQEHGPPFLQPSSSEKEADKKVSAEKYRPAIWIMTMAENGHFVPLHVFTEYEDNGLMLTAEAQLSVEPLQRPPLGAFRLMTVVALAVSGFLLWYALVRWPRKCRSKDENTLEPKKPRNSWRYRLMDLFGAALFAARSIWQNLTLSVIVLALWPIFVVLAFLAVSYARDANALCLAFLALPALVISALSFCAQVRLSLTCRESWDKSELGRWGLTAARTLVVGQLLFVIGFSFWFCAGLDRTDRFLFVERDVALANGYSVFAPVAVICAGFLVRAFSGMRIHYVDFKFRVSCPFPAFSEEQKKSPPGPGDVAFTCNNIFEQSKLLGRDLTNVREFFASRSREVIWAALAFAVFAFVAMMKLLWSSNLTWEGRPWNWLVFSAGMVLVLLIVGGLFRFIAAWANLRCMLNKIAVLPMLGAFDRIPDEISALLAGYFAGKMPRAFQKHVLLQILKQLREDRVAWFIREADPKWRTEKCAVGEKLDEEYSEFCDSSVVARSLVKKVTPIWHLQDAPETLGNEPQNVSTGVSKDPSAMGGESEALDSVGLNSPASPPANNDFRNEWVKKAENFIAIQTVVFISKHIVLMRALGLSLIYTSAALFLAVTAYPFQPELLILLATLLLMVSVGITVVWALISYQKNEIISRITHTTPHKVDWDWSFISGVATTVGPLLLIGIAHLSGGLRLLVEPVLDVVR